MLKPFRFGWQRIMPILYNDYVSETELLNAIIMRYEEFVTELNKIGKSLDELGGTLDDYKDVILSMIENIKKSQSDIDELKKKHLEDFAKLKGYIDNAINDMQADVDYKLSEKMEELERLLESVVLDMQKDIKNLYARFELLEVTVNISIESLERKLDSEISAINRNLIKMLSAQWTSTVKFVTKKISEISADSLMVFNPYNGKKQTLQEYINYHYDYSTLGLTAKEYRLLYLTAEEYRNLNLTAYEYRMYGISTEEGISRELEEQKKHYDLFGQRRLEPVSSVFSAFDACVDASMDGFDLTAEEYRYFSDIYGAYNLDRYGLFILSNNMPSLMKTTVSVISDTWVQQTDSEREDFETVLTLKEDIPKIEQINLLGEKSVDDLITDFLVEFFPPELEGYTFTGEYESYGYSISNKHYELDDEGIRVTAMLENHTYAIYESNATDNPETKLYLVPAVIDVKGITTI